jgi:CBS domain-containing protein
MPFTIKQLLGPNRNLISVHDTDPVSKAHQLMVKHKFSQLPVTDQEGKALGLISSDSILRALSMFGVALEKLRVLDATEKVKRTFREDDDLFSLLDDLKETAAVLIVDGKHMLLDIVTSYDTTEYFRRRAEDFMYAEDIEATLKSFINAYFTGSDGEIDDTKRAAAIAEITSSNQDQLKALRGALQHYASLQNISIPIDNDFISQIWERHFAQKEVVKPFEKLTQDQYITIFVNEHRWERYKDLFSFDRTTIKNLLEEAKSVRNSIAHFRSDEITTEQREKLKASCEWLLFHEEAVKQNFGIKAPAPEEKISSAVSEGAYLAISETLSTDIPLLDDPAASSAEEVENAETVSSEEEYGPSTSRYTSLAIWLQERPVDQQRISLTFSQVEAIISDTLPGAARQHPSWWGNDALNSPQSQQWLEVGWRIYSVDVRGEIVSFTRSRELERGYAGFYAELYEQLTHKATFPLKKFPRASRNWLIIAKVPATGAHPISLAFSFSHSHRFRVELYIDSGIKEWNKQIFAKLLAREESIRQDLAEFAEGLTWERMENRRASRIALYHEGAITDSPEELEALRNWACHAMLVFQSVMKKRVSEIVQGS